jgi:UDP:flavonoid glycosyltransferase YjiC (YdhE family)
LTDAPAVLLLAVDSWGGVASMITLAEALRTQGVNARIAAFSDYGDKVRAAGFGFTDFGVSIAEVMAGQNARRPGWARDPLRTWTELRAGLKDTALAVVSSVADAVEPGEIIVSGTLTVGTATGIAGLRGARVVALNPAPMTPSRLPEASLSPVLRRPSRLNEWVGRFGLRVAEWLYRPAVSAGREALGLPPWTASDYLAAVNRAPTIYGVSPALMPADPAWPAHITVTGHLLRADPEPVIPEGLPEFLAGHPGAIYVGFGSLGNAVGQSDLDTARRALAMAGRPGVIAGMDERGELAGAGTPVFAVGEVSHDWLFPKLAAVVHHGGSGTTHRAVLAGVPSMAVPVGFDQPYWGRRLAELGVGVPPIPYRKLSPARLATAIGHLTGDPEIATRAKRLSAVLSAENGPSAAAGVVMAALGAGRD